MKSKIDKNGIKTNMHFHLKNKTKKVANNDIVHVNGIVRACVWAKLRVCHHLFKDMYNYYTVSYNGY